MNLKEIQNEIGRNGRAKPVSGGKQARIIRNAIVTNAITSAPTGPGGKN